MKYIDAEKIRAEIERLKRHAEESKMEWVNEGYNQNAFVEACRIRSYDKLLTFLDNIEEPVSEDLEEAAMNYIAPIENEDGLKVINFSGRDLKDAFIAGAEWQKAKMMKGAVEGFVGVHLHDKRADVTVNTGYLPKEMGIRGDSKVRVIIVKEDEK